MERFFKTPEERFANYQENLRRSMSRGVSDVYWDPDKTYDAGDYQSGKGIYTFAPDEEILAAQPKSWQEAVHGDTWEGLSDRDQHQLAKRFPGTTPTLRDPDWTYDPNWAKAQGGRVGYAIGSPEKQLEAGAPPIIYEGNMDPRAQNQRTGLPSIPGPIRMAKDGPEFDMRQRGGFQPLGRQEGKDDVPAMLAKNEFVMTSDAVRAAGGGSIQKGAQRMYDTMKKLERRVG